MTEDQLFEAVHEYGDFRARLMECGASPGEWEELGTTRAELLDAIREYVASLPVEICEPAYAQWMRAKAAVCDAWRAVKKTQRDGWDGGADEYVALNKALWDAEAELREIEGSAT